MNQPDGSISVPPIFKKFSQYVIVGGIAFCVDTGILVAFTETFGFHYLVSAGIGFIAGLVVNYLLSIRWVFKTRVVANKHREFLIFSVIGISGLGLNQSSLYLLTEMLGQHYLTSKIITAVLILLFNFYFRHWLLFSNQSPLISRT